MHTNRLSGKAGIVTGGARGLGRAFCQRLALEGMAVAIADLDGDRAEVVAGEIRAAGGTAMAVTVDVTSPEGTMVMAGQVAQALGGIDLLVNNAAYYYGISRRPFWDLDPAEWDRVMAVNVKGCWLCARAVWPHMKDRGSGKIINISSGAFFSGAGPFSHYVASKGAVIGLTHAMAKELGSYGITVNAVAPGITDTEATRSIISEEEASHLLERRCLRRAEQPEDLVGIIAFLASGDSDFITGQTFLVDGGTVLR